MKNDKQLDYLKVVLSCPGDTIQDSIEDVIEQLQDIYNNLNNLTEEQKQKVNRRNEMEFDTIGRCLHRVEETIKVETE